jgi:hypothetical protein
MNNLVIFSENEEEANSQPPRLPEEEERRPSVSERAQLFMRLSELHRQSANPSPRQRDSARRYEIFKNE